MLGLEQTAKAAICQAPNINTILGNDARLKEAFKQNSLTAKDMFLSRCLGER
jgi:hypothetical protein